MAFTTHRGQRIHYEVHGQGPPVVLLHGLSSDGASWSGHGYVPRLESGYQVVTMDSLGHGASDAPTDRALYTRQQQAGDVAAVLDAVGAESAHVVGYSMGSWIATGLALHHPARLLSVSLGGWDPVSGPAHGHGKRALVRAGLRAVRSALSRRLPRWRAWITRETDPIRACWLALVEVRGGPAALRTLRCPVLLWCGARDAYFAGARTFAETCGFPFFACAGDHQTALAEATAVSARLREFFDDSRAASRGGAAPITE